MTAAIRGASKFRSNLLINSSTKSIAQLPLGSAPSVCAINPLSKNIDVNDSAVDPVDDGHSKDVTIPKGTNISAFIQGDLTLDQSKFQKQLVVSK